MTDCVWIPSKYNLSFDWPVSRQLTFSLQTMHAHAQFCWSGDNTVNATKIAVDSLAKEEDDCDEAIVIILSDENLSRYGISLQKLAQTLTSQEPKVQAYTIFIGSLDNEAQI